MPHNQAQLGLQQQQQQLLLLLLLLLRLLLLLLLLLLLYGGGSLPVEALRCFLSEPINFLQQKYISFCRWCCSCSRPRRLRPHLVLLLQLLLLLLLLQTDPNASPQLLAPQRPHLCAFGMKQQRQTRGPQLFKERSNRSSRSSSSSRSRSIPVLPFSSI